MSCTVYGGEPGFASAIFPTSSSQIASGYLGFLSIHDRSSLKFVGLVFWQKLHSNDDHTELSSLHDHNVCNVLSSSLKHRSHSGLSMMCRCLRFAFVGMESRQGRHMKFFILFGTHKSQMLFQKFLSLICVASAPSLSTSYFKN